MNHKKYISPIDLFNGQVPKGTIYYKEFETDLSCCYYPVIKGVKHEGTRYSMPKEMVELWEEYVENPDVKIGEWITVTGSTSGGWLDGTLVKTFQVRKEKSSYHNGVFYGIANDKYKLYGGLYADYRKATINEVHKNKVVIFFIRGYSPVINWHKGTVKIGCTEWVFQTIYDIASMIEEHGFDTSHKSQILKLYAIIKTDNT